MKDGIKIKILRDVGILFYSCVLWDLFVKHHKGKKPEENITIGKSSSEYLCMKPSGISFTNFAELWIQSVAFYSTEKDGEDEAACNDLLEAGEDIPCLITL